MLDMLALEAVIFLFITLKGVQIILLQIRNNVPCDQFYACSKKSFTIPNQWNFVQSQLLFYCNCYRIFRFGKDSALRESHYVLKAPSI